MQSSIPYILSSSILWISIIIVFNYLIISDFQLVIANCILAGIFIFLTTLITNKFALATYIVLVCEVCLYLANIFKIKALNSGIIITDINYLIHFIDYKFYLIAKDYFLSPDILFAVIVSVILIKILGNYISYYNNNFIDYSRNSQLSYIIIRTTISTIVILFLIVIFNSMLKPNSYINQVVNYYIENDNINVKNKSNISPIMYGQYKNDLFNQYGPWGSIIISIQHYNQKEINISKIDNLTDKQKTMLESLKENQFKNINRLPNIIMILHESIFDIQYLNYEFRDKKIDRVLYENQFSKFNGALNVHTYGGSSWISEFESISGIPLNLFPIAGKQPFIKMVNDIKNISLAHELKKIGYKTIVIYPVSKSFSNAEFGYYKLGFDTILDISDFDISFGEYFSSIEDKTMYKAVMNIINSNTAQPVLIMISTISNHAPHNSNYPDLLDLKHQILDKTLVSKLNDYLSKLDKINKAFRVFLNNIMLSKNDTIIVNFGDHLPSFEGKTQVLKWRDDAITLQEGVNYRTFYNIMTNFDINIMKQYEYLDIVFFPSIILDMLGLNHNDFYKISSNLRRHFKGIIHNNITNDDESLMLQYYFLKAIEETKKPIIHKLNN